MKLTGASQEHVRESPTGGLCILSSVQTIMGLRVTWRILSRRARSVMGNHRSYVDAVLFPVGFPVVYVGRIESKSWPIIGWGATLLGTIWVDRKSKDSRRATRAAVRERLSEGMGIVIFPEGTTFKGPQLLEYRPGMFYTCAEEGFPIVPVALEYRDPNIAWWTTHGLCLMHSITLERNTLTSFVWAYL